MREPLTDKEARATRLARERAIAAKEREDYLYQQRCQDRSAMLWDQVYRRERGDGRRGVE